MSWWQVLLILAMIVVILGFLFSMQVARHVEHGKQIDRGVGKRVAKYKIRANPIFWVYIAFAVIVLAVMVYYIFVYPEGAY